MNKVFEYQSNGIRKTMCKGCPHKNSISISKFGWEDYDFISLGHSHRCHTDGDKNVACRGVCEKAKLLGYTLINEGDTK